MANTTDSPTTPPPPALVLQMLTGKWVSQAISTAAQLRIPDLLVAGPQSLEDLSTASQTNARSLLGLLRALASVGVFAERGETRFENTPLSEVLRSDVPRSMRALALFLGEQPTWRAWGELPYTIRTGRSAFRQAHGELPYEYFAKHPEAASYFNEAFTSFSAQEMDAIHKAFEFSAAETLVDVGGGQGAMLASILRKNARQKGILFDQSHVVRGAEGVVASYEVVPRCEIVGGDFFVSVPAGADGYLLKHVLFNWNDEDALKILTNVRRAVPPKGRLYVIDPVIQPGSGQTFAKFMDLEMMVLYDGGCQRTQAEFAKLFDRAGFKLLRVVDTEAPSSIIEAVPV
jgi:hypothetical protein